MIETIKESEAGSRQKCSALLALLDGEAFEAEIPDGVPDNVVRIVTENSQALRFKNHGFEKE